MLKLGLLVLILLFSHPLQATDDAWVRSYNLEASGQYLAAADSLEAILKRTPNHEMALLRSGWLYYLAGNYSSAIKYYQSALKANKHSVDARLGMTLPLMAQARWREAAAHARTVIDESKWHYYANLRLLICEEGLKQWEVMRKHAEQLTERYPSDAGFYVYLARAQINLGKAAQAKIAYGKVLERYPGHLEASRFVAQ